jgi:transposase-like protein
VVYKTEEKNEILERWKNSGLTRAQFCKEHGISSSSLHKWLNKLNPDLQSATNELMPVSIVNKKSFAQQGAPEQTLIEISLPTQTIVRFKLPIKNLVTFVQEISHAVATIR